MQFENTYSNLPEHFFRRTRPVSVANPTLICCNHKLIEELNLKLDFTEPEKVAKIFSGNIILDGKDLTELPMYRRARLGIGYLPQETSIFRGLTVENNIRAVLEVVDKSSEKREATLESLLAEFSITHLRRTPSLALSGGERRRVEIARALASRPHFILLDEPLAGIDPIAVSDIRDLISHLKERGIGVLITDHNVRDTLDIIDRAYIIHDGMVLMEGSPSDIVGNEDVRRVYLGDRFNL